MGRSVLRPYEFVANGETCVRANLNPHLLEPKRVRHPTAVFLSLVLILGIE
jgi:hypothetical protein